MIFRLHDKNNFVEDTFYIANDELDAMIDATLFIMRKSYSVAPISDATEIANMISDKAVYTAKNASSCEKILDGSRIIISKEELVFEITINMRELLLKKRKNEPDNLKQYITKTMLSKNNFEFTVEE